MRECVWVRRIRLTSDTLVAIGSKNRLIYLDQCFSILLWNFFSQKPKPCLLMCDGMANMVNDYIFLLRQFIYLHLFFIFVFTDLKWWRIQFKLLLSKNGAVGLQVCLILFNVTNFHCFRQIDYLISSTKSININYMVSRKHNMCIILLQ